MSSKMTFFKWLTQYGRKKNSRGDLIRFIDLDSYFPRSSKFVLDGLEYLRKINAEPELIKTYESAWHEYRKLNLKNIKQIHKLSSNLNRLAHRKYE